MEYNGEYGGRVLRKFKGGGTQFISGATLKPEDVKEWPLSNRRALSKVGSVEWYGPPSLEETKARSEAKEIVTKVEVTPKVKETVKPPVRTSRRTKITSKGVKA